MLPLTPQTEDETNTLHITDLIFWDILRGLLDH